MCRKSVGISFFEGCPNTADGSSGRTLAPPNNARIASVVKNNIRAAPRAAG